MQQTLFDQGMDLLIFGMGTVFVFLTLLIICTLLMSQVVGRLLPEAPEPVAPPAATGASGGARPVSARTIAVIEAAVKEHRSRRG